MAQLRRQRKEQQEDTDQRHRQRADTDQRHRQQVDMDQRHRQQVDTVPLVVDMVLQQVVMELQRQSQHRADMANRTHVHKLKR